MLTRCPRYYDAHRRTLLIHKIFDVGEIVFIVHATGYDFLYYKASTGQLYYLHSRDSPYPVAHLLLNMSSVKLFSGPTVVVSARKSNLKLKFSYLKYKIDSSLKQVFLLSKVEEISLDYYIVISMRRTSTRDWNKFRDAVECFGWEKLSQSYTCFHVQDKRSRLSLNIAYLLSTHIFGQSFLEN
jgi:hypothetical protein